jgi:hypothetical protein
MEDPTRSRDEFESFLRRSRSELDEMLVSIPKIREAALSQVATLAGEEGRRMLCDVERAKRNLDHPEGAVRRAALLICLDRLKPGPNSWFARKCETMALSETDPLLKSDSMSALGYCYGKTQDRRISRILAEFAHESSLPEPVRAISYSALLTVRGVPLLQRPVVGLVRFSDIDWEFVGSFL